MSDKLKKLHIKKLIQEYEFLTTEDEYRKEIITDYRNEFMDKVVKVRKELNIPFPDIHLTGNTIEEINEDRIENISNETKNKIKKLYREIVKLTHPDKVNSEELIELYRRATIAAEKQNILELFQICVELKIPVELDFEDVDILTLLIEDKRKEIKKIDGSFIWLWFLAKTDEEKNEIITMFVKQHS